MTSLPIDQSLPKILTSLREHRRLVLVAPPGAGKTTRVPPALVRSGLLSQEHPGVIVLQPRRVAARATAARIADEQNWSLGEEVGYQIRFERRISATTRLRIQTEGILNRQLLADPLLETIGAVVLDEFHERSLHSDLALALLREIRRDVRPDLIIVVMSATLDAEPVAQFLDDCPVVRVEGRTFPIELSYHPSVRPASPEAIEPLVREVLANRSA
ncbi:MAG: DEAD/DEAH box helicase, partial [Isosphaeraceae bacterium]